MSKSSSLPIFSFQNSLMLFVKLNLERVKAMPIIIDVSNLMSKQSLVKRQVHKYY